jgi:hypothetical protein
MQPSNTTPGIYPKECGLAYNRGTCIPIFIAALFTIANYGNNQDAPPLMNGLRNFGIYNKGILGEMTQSMYAHVNK